VIDASKFTGHGGLQLSGNSNEEVQGKINAYISLMTVSYQNLLWLIGKYHAEGVSDVSPLTDAQLLDIRVTSAFLSERLNLMLKLAHPKLALLTEYQVFDWSSTFDNAGWSRVPSKFAIIGFWRSGETRLANLEYVLAGKGFWDELGDSREADWGAALDGNWAWGRCDPAPGGGTQLIRALERSQGTSGDNWMYHLERAECVAPVGGFGSQCIEQAISPAWAPNSWMKCEGLGYYMAGIRRGSG